MSVNYDWQLSDFVINNGSKCKHNGRILYKQYFGFTLSDICHRFEYRYQVSNGSIAIAGNFHQLGRKCSTHRAISTLDFPRYPEVMAVLINHTRGSVFLAFVVLEAIWHFRVNRV